MPHRDRHPWAVPPTRRPTESGEPRPQPKSPLSCLWTVGRSMAETTRVPDQVGMWNSRPPRRVEPSHRSRCTLTWTLMIQRDIGQATPLRHNTFMHRPVPEGPHGHAREIIETLRKQRGFTSMRALALAAGISQPTLSRFMAGTNDALDLHNFFALAQTLEVTVSELLGEVPLLAHGSARLRELVRVAERLPEPHQDALLAAGRAMADSSKSKR